jgi:hypothetical protein
MLIYPSDFFKTFLMIWTVFLGSTELFAEPGAGADCLMCRVNPHRFPDKMARNLIGGNQNA